MKLLLDMYRSAPKEQRDKVQLMAAEKKTKAEVNLSFTHIHIQINLCLHETGTFHFILRVCVSGRGATSAPAGSGGEGEEGRKEDG